MWSKFRLNVCNNLPQTILGAGVGCYTDSEHMKAISDGLRRELEAEIDMFSGALIRMGKELGIPVPYNEYAYHVIKALEERNDGKLLLFTRKLDTALSSYAP